MAHIHISPKPILSTFSISFIKHIGLIKPSFVYLSCYRPLYLSKSDLVAQLGEVLLVGGLRFLEAEISGHLGSFLHDEMVWTQEL